MESAFKSNARFRAVAVLLGALLVGLHCFNAFVGFSAARSYAAPASPVAGGAFALQAPLDTERLVGSLLAAQDYVETTNGVVQRTLVSGATIRPGAAGVGFNVTLHLLDGRDVTVF